MRGAYAFLRPDCRIRTSLQTRVSRAEAVAVERSVGVFSEARWLAGTKATKVQMAMSPRAKLRADNGRNYDPADTPTRGVL